MDMILESENEILDNISENILLTDKYNLKSIDDLILPKITLSKLKRIIKEKDLNHSIFIGKSSTGKTSTAILLVRNLIKPEDSHDNFLYLNASDDRGLNMIQNLIMPFCEKKIDESKIKLVLIDEANSLTSKAQAIISNLMDEKKVKFILIANDLSEISNSIQSRSSLIFFPQMNKEDLVKKILTIIKKEKINLSKEVIEKICDITEKDIRQSLNFIESLIGISKELEITVNDIYDIFDQPNPLMVRNILESLKKDLIKSLDLVKDLLDKGFSSNDILLSILNFLTFIAKDFPEESEKIIIYEIVSKYYIRVNQGTETKWQVYGCIIELFNELKKS